MLDTAYNLVGSATPWWWSALSSPLSLTCLGIGAGAVLLLVVLGRALHRMTPRQPHSSQSGTATIEFCLVFPIVLFLALLLAQTTTLMGGNLVVHYAAFAAARTAIVQIPADYADYGEPANWLYHNTGGRKYDAIFSAAAVALWPVAGRAAAGDVPADRVVSGVRSHFAAYGATQPAWIDALLADRLRYASSPENTSITVYRFDNSEVPGTPLIAGESTQFGPKDPVTVKVDHRLNLGVPYVRAIFADGRLSTGGMYSNVTARFTLTNEGIPDDLPPLPELERRP